MKSEILSDKELRKFSQQIQLHDVGPGGQELIKKARVLVIGAGGKGSTALQDLVTSGVGRIGICDNYLVEDPALPRQSLYGDSDLGRQKAIIASQRLSELTRLTNFELHNICLSESNIQTIISSYDIVLDATDNFAAHYLINDACLNAGKPVVFGSVYHNTIIISVFNYKNGPSLRSLYPDVPHNQDGSSDEGIASEFFPYSMAGNFMAHETLKIILRLEGTLSGKVLRFCISDYSCTIDSLSDASDH